MRGENKEENTKNNHQSFRQKFFNLDQDNYNQTHLQSIKQQVISENYQKGIFDLENRSNKYLKQSLEISGEISNKYQNLIVCGMGGSSLGAKAICGTRFFDIQNSQKTHNKKIHFLDNIHHQNLNDFLQTLSFEKTAFLFISKSGKTIETICQTLLIINFYQQQITTNKAQNLYFITEKNNKYQNPNPLAKIANNYQRPIIPHDQDIGGRYSCFTPVALIPVAFYSINIEQYLNGAKDILNDFINDKTDLIQKGAYFLQQAQQQNLDIQVSMPYLARLYHFNYWYNQLLAESIGKNGQGITPLKALGSVDQHSVLQLFLDGKKDKFFTFLTTNNQNKGDDLKVPEYLQDELRYLKNNKLGDVIYANQEATIKIVKNKNLLLRRFDIKQLDEYTLGQLMMYFMLEAIFYAKITKVDPFDQPAVEEGKSYAKQMLSD
jgi:glucose-6-phosphate isomerase